jgi:hypothetical protein
LPGSRRARCRVRQTNLLNGLELSTLEVLNAQARLWLDTVANVRVHGATHRRPVDLFAAERSALTPRAQAYFEALSMRRTNARDHLRRIVALAEIHGQEAVARAIDDELEF